MQNRLTQRRRLVFAACCFSVAVACAFGLVAPAEAAGLNVITVAKGSDFLFGSSAMTFQASSGDLLNQPPLQAGGETVSAGTSDSLFGAGGGTYSSSLTVDSTEIIKQDSTKKVELSGPGSYYESAFYFGVANSFTGNASPCDLNETLINGTFPRNEMAYITSHFSGDSLNYQSLIKLSALAVEQPDTLQALMQATGEGYGQIHTGTLSEVGFDCNTTVGYTQYQTSDIMAGGTYEIAQAYNFVSFTDAFQLAELPV